MCVREKKASIFELLYALIPAFSTVRNFGLVPRIVLKFSNKQKNFESTSKLSL